jgi:hypothetical protein
MNFATRLIAIALMVSAFAVPLNKLDAYSYQPDGGGYAYVDSGYSVSSSPLIPLAAVSAAVLIGVLLYSGHHHHHHHGH